MEQNNEEEMERFATMLSTFALQNPYCVYGSFDGSADLVVEELSITLSPKMSCFIRTVGSAWTAFMHLGYISPDDEWGDYEGASIVASTRWLRGRWQEIVDDEHLLRYELNGTSHDDFRRLRFDVDSILAIAFCEEYGHYFLVTVVSDYQSREIIVNLNDRDAYISFDHPYQTMDDFWQLFDYRVDSDDRIDHSICAFGKHSAEWTLQRAQRNG